MMQDIDKQNPQPASGQPATPRPDQPGQQGGTPAPEPKSGVKPQPLERDVAESGLPADPDPDDPVSP